MTRAGTLRFWLSFLFLNALLVVRFPEQVPLWRYAAPSLDLLALVVSFILLSAWGKRLPLALRSLVLVYFVASFWLGVADGIEQGAYLRRFSLALDLPLLPELVRLFKATLPAPLFALVCSSCVASLAALGYVIHRALEVLRVELGSPALVRVLCPIIGGCALLAAFAPQAAVIQPSRLVRFVAEARAANALPDYRASEQARIAARGHALEAGPHDLKKLLGQHVYLFLIESYGQTVLDRSELFQRIEPEYQRWDRELSAAGFQIASRVLDSPIYGGRSWLAQASLLTGVPVHDSLQFELLRRAEPRTFSQVFAAAGYRTVLVQPGTVRPDTQRDLLQFEQRYVNSQLGYHGPRYGWATMPDQFVLEAVRQRELSSVPERPRFLVYALVSSHVPWSALPPVVADWATLGDGSLFLELPMKRYATSWLDLSGASTAYADGIAYDLEILRRYLLEFVRDDSLVLVLGDHQPHSGVTAQQPSPGVPVHVLSRNGAFVAPFRARGYTPGMVADEALPHPGLESLLPDLVADFSLGPSGGAR